MPKGSFWPANFQPKNKKQLQINIKQFKYEYPVDLFFLALPKKLDAFKTPWFVCFLLTCVMQLGSDSLKADYVVARNGKMRARARI